MLPMLPTPFARSQNPGPARTRRLRPALLVAAIALALAPWTAVASPTEVLSDLRKGTDTGSGLGEIAAVGGTTVLVVEGPSGAELYTSDGTAAGTTLLVDLLEGPGSSFPTGLTPFGGDVYFIATDADHGRELFRTDGTAGGTTLVADVAPNGSSNPFALQVVNGALYFAADDGTNGIELWRSDGTAGGTTLVLDVNPGGDAFFDQVPFDLFAFGGQFFFAADDGTNGREPWISDGTPGGTSLFLDILPGPGSSTTDLDGAVLGGHFLFGAWDGSAFGQELWITDGTALGTSLLVDVNPSGSSEPDDFVVFDGRAYFVANGGAALGEELFVTDGSFAGTSLFLDANPGAANGFLGGPGTDFRIAGTNLFFNVSFGANAGLWATDGTTTTLLTSAFNGNDVGAALGGALYFRAANPLFGDLWVSDGTIGGTAPITSANFNPIVAGESQGRIWFSAADANGREPWQTDGTIGGEVFLGDRLQFEVENSNPEAFTRLGADTLFAADADGDALKELWITDGSEAGTTLLSSVTLDPDPNLIVDFLGPQIHTTGGFALFAGSDGTSGEELWRTDGTPGGTTRIADLATGATSSNPGRFADLGGRTLFVANDGSGNEPWVTDGTGPGTFRLADLNAGSGGSLLNLPTFFPAPLFFPLPSGDALFAAFDPAIGTELYQTDGTIAGTSLVVDLNAAGSGASTLGGVIGGTLVFAGDDGTTGIELYASDGTAAGTQLIVDLQPGLAASTPRAFARVGERLFFIAEDALLGTEVWVTDGTAAGTLRLTDQSVAPTGLFRVQTRVFFFAGPNGGQLWTSDGTVAGTQAVGTFNPTSAFFVPDIQENRTPLAVGPRLFFRGDDGVRGAEPWVSDGTFAGTMPLANLLQNGPILEADSNPTDLALLSDGRLIFAAETRFAGREAIVETLPEPGLPLGLSLGLLAGALACRPRSEPT